jgi:hypothetical protein
MPTMLLHTLMLILLLHLSGTGATAVKLYQRVEQTISWENHGLENPVYDVDLRLSITAPSGRTLGSDIVFYGFYDGDGAGAQTGNLWRFRLLFDEPGSWTVKALFCKPNTTTPASGAPAAKSYTYEVSSAKISASEHGHVYVDPQNWRRFRCADGTPWVPFVMHSSMLLERTFSIAKQWVDEHHNLGVDALAVRFHPEGYAALAPSASIPAEYGETIPRTHYTYLSHKGNKVSVDLQKFNLSSWQYNEKIIEYCQSKGVRLSIWFGISGMNTQYWSYGASTDADKIVFIKYFLARWAAYSCWWHWTVDSEYTEPAPTDAQDLQNNVWYAKKLQELNPWRTLVTTHVLRDWTPQDNHDGAFGLATLQKRVSDHNDSLVVQSKRFIDTNDDYGIAVYNAEGIWMLSNPARTRVAMWAHSMAGGFGEVAHDGDNHLISSWGVSWDKVTPRHREDAAVLGAMARFFNQNPAIDICLCQPAHSLVSVAGGGDKALCLAQAGKSYYLWLNQGGTPTINLTGETGTFTLTRYSCTELDKPTNLGTVSGEGSITLPKTSATGFGKDYLYVLQKSGTTTLTITTPLLPPAIVGSPYTQTLGASDATGTVSWTITAGALPAGLVLDNSKISGTPTTATTATFSITARDERSSVTKEFSLQVQSPGDTTPPKVSNVQVVNQTVDSVTISWTTDEAATSRVQWGTEAGNYPGESGELAGMHSSHRVTLRDHFTPGHTYHLLIITADAAGNTTTHPESFIMQSTAVQQQGLLNGWHHSAPPLYNEMMFCKLDRARGVSLIDLRGRQILPSVNPHQLASQYAVLSLGSRTPSRMLRPYLELGGR